MIEAPFSASKGPEAPPLLPRILVAEDNPVCRAAVHGLLARLGYPVDSVGDGREALEALGRTEYDVVLLDLEMPELGGLEVVRELRGWAREYCPRTIALTAAAAEREACLKAGMDGFLAKPVRVADLQEALSSLPPRPLDQPAPCAEASRSKGPVAPDAWPQFTPAAAGAVNTASGSPRQIRSRSAAGAA